MSNPKQNQSRQDRRQGKGNSRNQPKQESTTGAATEKLEPTQLTEGAQSTVEPGQGEQFQGDIILGAQGEKSGGDIEPEVIVEQSPLKEKEDRLVNAKIGREAGIQLQIIEDKVKEYARYGRFDRREHIRDSILGTIQRSVLAGVLNESVESVNEFCIGMRDLYRAYPNVLNDSVLLQHVLSDTRTPENVMRRYKSVVSLFNTAFHTDNKVKVSIDDLGKLLGSEKTANALVNRLNTMSR